MFGKGTLCHSSESSCVNQSLDASSPHFVFLPLWISKKRNTIIWLILNLSSLIKKSLHEALKLWWRVPDRRLKSSLQVWFYVKSIHPSILIRQPWSVWPSHHICILLVVLTNRNSFVTITVLLFWLVSFHAKCQFVFTCNFCTVLTIELEIYDKWYSYAIFMLLVAIVIHWCSHISHHSLIEKVTKSVRFFATWYILRNMWPFKMEKGRRQRGWWLTLV